MEIITIVAHQQQSVQSPDFPDEIIHVVDELDDLQEMNSTNSSTSATCVQNILNDLMELEENILDSFVGKVAADLDVLDYTSYDVSALSNNATANSNNSEDERIPQQSQQTELTTGPMRQDVEESGPATAAVETAAITTEGNILSVDAAESYLPRFPTDSDVVVEQSHQMCLNQPVDRPAKEFTEPSAEYERAEDFNHDGVSGRTEASQVCEKPLVRSQLTDRQQTNRMRSNKLRIIYPGEREHKCKLCTKIFRHRSDLSAHLLNHNQDGDLLRQFVAFLSWKCPDYNIPSYDDPMLITQTEMHSADRLTSDNVNENSKQISWSGHEMGVGAQKNSAGPSEEFQFLTNQAERQQQMILEMQKQLCDLTDAIQSQNRHKLLNEVEKRPEEAQVAHESALSEILSTGVQPENVEGEKIPMNNLHSLCVSNELSCRRSERVRTHMPQPNEKRAISLSNDKVEADAEQPRRLSRVDKSKISLWKKQVNCPASGCDYPSKVRSIIRVKRSNVATNPIDRKRSEVYSCAECGKQFSHKGHLTEHLRIHTGEKPYKCKECQAAFSRSGHLTQHQMIHSGTKPFECQICNVAFTQKQNLSRHQLIHTNEKPFKCDICKKSFVGKKYLSDHMNIHSGRKPHECNVCRKTFRQQSTIIRHRKIHVKE